MDVVSTAPFQELLTHLSEIENDPHHKRLNSELLKDVGNSLGPSTSRDDAWTLLMTGERILNIIEEDPRPLTRLLEKDISLIPFNELKDTISVDKLEGGLDSPSTPIQLLCLAYLRKAADSPSGAAWVGSTSSLVNSLITTWLSSPSTEVAEQATEVILALLEVDHVKQKTLVEEKGRKGEAEGQGLLWRRLFHDPDIYALFFDLTSLRSPKYLNGSKKDIQQATISQGRLFDFIARISELDWSHTTQSHFPEIEAKYCGANFGEKGGDRSSLLQYAASYMIDETDALMSLLRRDFFVKLLTMIQEQGAECEVLPKRLLEEMKDDVGDAMDAQHDTSAGLQL